jgi:hypothetical protein
MRERPRIYLLVFLPLLLLGGPVVAALVSGYARFRGIPVSSVPNLNGMLIGLPALIFWIPLSLLTGNYILRIVPPLRKIAEEYSTRAKRPGFSESQAQLVRLTMLIGVICGPILVLGFWL